MRKKLYITLLLTFACALAWGQGGRKRNIDGVKNINPEVYSYYLECSRRIGEPVIMRMADTLSQMAREDGDTRTMCAAICFKQEYWIAREEADSVRHYKELVQAIAQEYGYPLYYYYAWGRQVESLLEMHLHLSALRELNDMRCKIDSSEYGMITYLRLMSKYFRKQRNYAKACEYAQQLVEYIEEEHLTDFNHHLNYTDVIDNLIEMGQYREALDWVARGRKKASQRKSQKLAFHAAEARVRVNMGDYAGAKAALDRVNALEPEGYAIKEVVECNMFYLSSTGQYAEALRWLECFDSLTHLAPFYKREHITFLAQIPGRELEALEMALRYIEVSDSVALEEQNASILEYAAAMKVDDLKTSLEHLRKRSTHREITILSVVVVVLSLFIIYLIATRRLLAKSTSARDRMEGELSAARGIQQRMLHDTFPSDRRVDMCAHLQSAMAVSGDLYDYLEDGDRIHFIVGDVSGKGLAASLFMSVTSCSFRNFASQSNCASGTMRRINSMACANNPHNTFITALVGCLDLNTGDLTLCNAGHNLPLLLTLDPQGHYQARRLELPVDIPLGLMPDTEYTCTRMRLKPGDRLFVYTDGVSESENEAFEQFGETRLIQALLEVADQPSGDILKHCERSVARHAAGVPQSDDITMMVLAYNGPK